LANIKEKTVISIEKLKSHRKILILFSIIFFLVIYLRTWGSGYLYFHSNSRLLAATLAEETKLKVCKTTFRPGAPCGDRNVMAEADLGIVIYIYILGITNEVEINSVASSIFLLRKQLGRSAVPVHIIFYDDLNRVHEVKSIKLKGE